MFFEVVITINGYFCVTFYINDMINVLDMEGPIEKGLMQREKERERYNQIACLSEKNDFFMIQDGRIDKKSDGYVQGYKGKKEADSRMKK